MDTSFDENYEFAAPQFHDFQNQGEQVDANADAWFETHNDSNNGLEDDLFDQELDNSITIAETNPWEQDQPSEQIQQQDQLTSQQPEEDSMDVEEHVNVENLDSELAPSENNMENGEPEQQDDHELAQHDSPMQEQHVQHHSSHAHHHHEHHFTVPDVDNTAHILQPTEASLAKRKSRENAKKRTRPGTAKTKKNQSGLTVPESPQFLSSRRSRKTQMLTSEEQELLEIEEMRKEAAKRRRLNKSSKAKVFSKSHEYAPSRSVKPLTEPKEFNFRTNQRPKTASASRSSSSVKSPDFHMRLRPQTAKRRTANGLTQPKPFSFRVDQRATVKHHSDTAQDEPQHSPYHSLAESVNKFQTKTPQRFRSKPANRKEYSPPKQPFRPGKLTRPASPKLSTRQRHRPTQELSTEEREAQEMANIKPFKARPLNNKIMHSNGNLGVPRVKSQPVTRPTDFQFKTEARSKVRPSETEEEVMERERKAREFKARPLNDGVIFGSNSGMAHVEKREITIPESPALMTKIRGQAKPKPEAPKEETPKPFKARPMFDDSPFVPEKSHKSVTRPVGFNLETEERGAVKQEQLQEHLQQQEEEEHNMKLFKAQPLPYDRPMIPQPSEKPLTVPQEFNLRIEQRGEEVKQAFDEFVHEELELEAQMHEFKARPIPEDKPFVVKKSLKPLTDINDFQLNSDHRAVDRHTFDEKMAKKQQQAELDAKQRAIQLAAQEAEEIKELRKKMTFKARPIMKSTGIVGFKSEQQQENQESVSRSMRV